jgi:hypothetical protein
MNNASSALGALLGAARRRAERAFTSGWRFPASVLRKSLETILAFTLFSLLALTGCARHYKITLSNGSVITTQSKPKLDKKTGAYHFKDARGQPAILPGFRIKEIEPL